jgi:hypothetical protein
VALNVFCIRKEDCDWYCDPDAKLRHGSTVVVTWNRKLVLSGTIANKRPVNYRRLRIRYRDDEGNDCITRIFGRGRKDAEVGIKVARVIGVFTPTKWAADEETR